MKIIIICKNQAKRKGRKINFKTKCQKENLTFNFKKSELQHFL